AVDAPTAALAAEALTGELGRLAVSRRELPRLPAVHLQRRAHGVAQPGQRLAIVGIDGVAAAVTAVHLAGFVEEEHHQGQIEVELEQAQIHALDPGQAHAHKVVGDAFDALETDNLPVKLKAVNSRHAANDDHEGFARFARLLLALGEAGQPAVTARV